MGAPLNTFKTYTGNVTTSLTTVYTAPTGYTTVVLLAQIANISGNIITVSGYHVRSGTTTALITNTQVPVDDAVNLLSGKLVLQTGDSFKTSASVDNASQILLSILETANP
jgi:hypothetical protein